MKKTKDKRLVITVIILIVMVVLIITMEGNNDIRAIYIALISIIYSFLKDVIDSFKEQKYNEKSFMSDFFKELYFKKITLDMPLLLSNYSIADNIGKSKTLNELDELIIGILDSSMFYKYHDYDFYEKIKKSVITIQDDIFFVKEKLVGDNYRIGVSDQKLNEQISELYDIMIEYYLGEK